MVKKLDKSHIIVLFIYMITFSLSIVLISNSISFGDSIPFEYNILATVAEGTTIDTTKQSHLKFNLYSEETNVYYNDEPISIDNKSFDIDISNLHGETIFIFKDDYGNIAKFKYYLSDSDGFLENYKIIDNTNIDSYITTHSNIKIIYTSLEKDFVDILINYIDELPQKLTQNIDTIKMIPYKNHSKIAGVTKDNNITLYKFSDYNEDKQKNIIIHEIAHTFINKMIDENVIDYSLNNYLLAVENDNNFVSSYSKRFTEKNGRPSEDLAESIAFYYIKPNFSDIYPNRTKYINSLLKI